IDDLDRCPPTRVVEVLEAVQLLLNTKLFVVVMGIDDRYIARALEQVYQGVLKRGGQPSGIDYLEKIIQIPYRMRPISPANIENYLRDQLNIPEKENDTSGSNLPTHSKDSTLREETKFQSKSQNQDQQNSTPTAPQTTTNSLSQPTINPPTKNTTDLLQEEESTQSQHRETESVQEIQPQSNAPKSATEKASIAAESVADESATQATTSESETTYLETVAEVAKIDEKEFQILVDCCKHVDINPRTAKRLINIYKILQIVWETRSQKKEHPQDLPTSPEKRVVISLLALSGRYPNYMRNVFDEISLQIEEAMLTAPPDSNTENNPKLDIALDQLLKDANPQPHQYDRHTQREWRRFTGDINRMLQNPKPPQTPLPKPPQTPLTQLIIDRRTFDLMRSFCFVGDVGYDPTDFHSPERAEQPN
ncbi:MAG: P-loop NTPase fold protein, partial [Cyanobacteria bacterium J06555_13]